MVIFYVVRHGNTEFNKKKRLQGGQIDSPLTNKGYKDALYLAKKLKDIKFDAVYSSDLGRTFITAHIIADTIGITNKIFRAKELREVDFGGLTGLLKEEVKLKYPSYKKNPHFKHLRGESYYDVKNRVIKKLLSLNKNEIKTLLIVTHAGCIRGIMSEALKKDLKFFINKKISNRFIAQLEIEKNNIVKFKIINQ